jgi:protein O-GlcNAc transferase
VAGSFVIFAGSGVYFENRNTARKTPMSASETTISAEIDRSLESADYAQTISICERAIESDPENLEYYYYLGLAYLLLGQEVDADDIWISGLLQAESTAGLASILQGELDRQLEVGNFSVARRIYDPLQSLGEEGLNATIDRHIEKIIASYLEEAKSALDRSESSIAEEIYHRLLSWDDQADAIWHTLGVFYYRERREKEALSCVLKALEIDDSKAAYHYTIGMVFERQYQLERAIQAYKKAIELDEYFLDAYNKLGNLFYQSGQLGEAEKWYRGALDRDSTYFPAYLNLANVYLVQQRWEEAKRLYTEARSLAAERPDLQQNQALFERLQSSPEAAAIYAGDFYYQRNYYALAIEEYERVFAKKIDKTSYYLDLANAYRILGKVDKALTTYDQAIAYHPTSVDLHLRRIWHLQNTRTIEEAIAATREALQIIPDSLGVQLELARLMPIVYENEKEIEFYRSKYTQELEKAIERLSLDTCQQREEALNSIGLRTNFYLQYQANNDLPLQNQYGDLVARILVANFPDRVTKRNFLRSEGEKIRIGYASAHIRHHTVAKLFKGWLAYRNWSQFEVYCYSIDIDNTIDDFTREYRQISDGFYAFDRHHPFQLIADQIESDRLDILVYLDIGMDARTTQLAGLRLAPVQCVTWGHPITSGLPTIDYFLSSDLMEPENADTHYREKLIRLPALGITYPKPDLPETRKTRAEMGLPSGKILYLNCQTLFKYLPRNDDIFPKIAQQVADSYFVFIAHRSDSVTKAFENRLINAFRAYGLDWHDYGTIVPQQSQTNYFHLNLLSDVYLDNLTWSGGNTTLEAIACNLPVVTCPGEFMRGRHSYAILTLLRLTEAIARDKDHYIELAIRFGLDEQWRQEIKQKIRQQENRVFDERTCIAGLEAFYRSVCP